MGSRSISEYKWCLSRHWALGWALASQCLRDLLQSKFFVVGPHLYLFRRRTVLCDNRLLTSFIPHFSLPMSTLHYNSVLLILWPTNLVHFIESIYDSLLLFIIRILFIRWWLQHNDIRRLFVIFTLIVNSHHIVVCHWLRIKSYQLLAFCLHQILVVYF